MYVDYSISDSTACLPNPCLNSGKCALVKNTFSCSCIASYKGASCDKGTIKYQTKVLRSQELQGNVSSRFHNNSEAFASELLENLEDMFQQCYTGGDTVISKFKFSTTHRRVTCRGRVDLKYIIVIHYEDHSVTLIVF